MSEQNNLTNALSGISEKQSGQLAEEFGQLRPKKIKAFPLYMGKSGCDYHRIKLPFIFGGEYFDNDAYQGFTTENLLHYLSISEVIVYNRNFPLGLEKINELRKICGFKIVVDLDDWVSLPDYHPNYRQYKEKAGKEILANVSNADCVTVTTERLYNRVKGYNKNVHIIPNALPYGHGQFRVPPEKIQRDDFNFIYTGQSSHLEDVRIMQSQINKIAKLPGISFSLAGYSQTGFQVWNRIENVFKPIPAYKRIESRPLHTYMTVYDESDCSVVPLCLNDFNSCKSNLKLLEAAAKKIPVIVSHVPPYRDDHNAPVLWVKEPGDWYKHMKFLSENRQDAVEMGQALHDWAFERFNLVKWNKVRFELYQSLLK